MVQAKIRKERQRNKAVIVVFALSPALSRILLMVSVRATFHYCVAGAIYVWVV